MNKHERFQSHDSANGNGNIKKDRYYVQSLTERIFLVREYLTVGGKAGPDDRIVRSFDIYHDAYTYANTMNGQADKSESPAVSNPSSLAE
jgi:hypothetical protein